MRNEDSNGKKTENRRGSALSTLFKLLVWGWFQSGAMVEARGVRFGQAVRQGVALLFSTPRLFESVRQLSAGNAQGPRGMRQVAIRPGYGQFHQAHFMGLQIKIIFQQLIV